VRCIMNDVGRVRSRSKGVAFWPFQLQTTIVVRKSWGLTIVGIGFLRNSWHAQGRPAPI